MEERPSWGEILRLRWGECSFGLGFALCLFLDLLELNIMLHPFTVHWCISRRWTALKWIFNAPLSQNVFRHTLHCTLFFPVVGLMNGVPRFGGMFPEAPHCPAPGLFPGEWWGFLPGIPGGLPSGAAWRGRAGCCCCCCLCPSWTPLLSAPRLLRLSALSEQLSSSSSSSSDPNSLLFSPPLCTLSDLVAAKLGGGGK